MANTVNDSGLVVNISAMDSDWTGAQRGALNSIQFNPGAADDKLVVKKENASGPVIFQSTADGSSDEVIKYFYDADIQPFIDHSECTLSSGHFIIVIYGA